MNLGYEHLIQELGGLRIAGPVTPCKIDRRVQAIVEGENGLLAPPSMEIERHDLMGHAEFALKHQGVHLEALQAICQKLNPALVQQALDANPNGKYVRQMAFLVEAFTGAELESRVTVTSYTKLFDEDKYVTGEDRRSAKFRVNQNGFGSLDYCPTIRRTPELERLMSRDLFADLAQFVERVGGARNLDRALGWAYLSETMGSFEIEGEKVSHDKAQRFVQLLHRAHHAENLTQEYLAELQSSTITNPFQQEAGYRNRQNWLSRGGRQYAGGVTYVPPPPRQAHELMALLEAYANAPYPHNSREALLKSLAVSFGFVFIHPFMDGNGRISRFLIHHGLCRAKLLEEGLILPLSVAFKQHEGDYLRCLESVSLPIKRMWQISYVDEDSIDATYKGDGDPWRFWDATAPVTFGLRMAHYALDHTLVDEIDFLEKFDRAYARIDRIYDLVNKDLVNLIRMAADEGKLSKNRRKQYAQRVPEHVLDAIEVIVREEFFGDEEGEDGN